MKRVGSDHRIASASAESLSAAAKIARQEAPNLNAMHRRLLYTLEDAQQAGFNVSDDWSVTDTRASSNAAEQAERQGQAQTFAARLRSQAGALLARDTEVSGNMTNAAAGVGKIHAVDNKFKLDGGPEPKSAADDAASDAASRYDQTRRAGDQAIVDQAKKEGRNAYLPSMEGQSGHMTREEADAADRLRDYKTITNPASGSDARQLAGERLDDYNKSKFVGPLPADTVLGGDARTRAQTRLGLQHDLENGNTSLDVPHFMTPDQATQLVNSMEATDRANVLTKLQEQLQHAGMSPASAAQVAEGYAHGMTPKEYVDAAAAAGKPFDAGNEALSRYTDLLDHGKHWKPEVGAFSAEDIATLNKAAGRMGWPGNALALGTGLYEWLGEGKSPLEVGAKAAGGWAGLSMGAEAGGEFGAFLGGPTGAFIGAFAGGLLGGFGGDWLGERGYQWLTH